MTTHEMLAVLRGAPSPVDLIEVRRSLSSLPQHHHLEPYAWELDSLLRDGLCEEAVRRIDLILNPKFDSAYECLKQYRAHMRTQHGVAA